MKLRVPMCFIDYKVIIAYCQGIWGFGVPV